MSFHVPGVNAPDSNRPACLRELLTWLDERLTVLRLSGGEGVGNPYLDAVNYAYRYLADRSIIGYPRKPRIPEWRENAKWQDYADAALVELQAWLHRELAKPLLSPAQPSPAARGRVDASRLVDTTPACGRPTSGTQALSPSQELRGLQARIKQALDAPTPEEGERHYGAELSFGGRLLKRLQDSGVLAQVGVTFEKIEGYSPVPSGEDWRYWWIVWDACQSRASREYPVPPPAGEKNLPPVRQAQVVPFVPPARHGGLAAAVESAAEFAGWLAKRIEKATPHGGTVDDRPSDKGPEQQAKPAAKPERSKRRRKAKAAPRQLTTKQTEAVQAYGDFNGDIPKAARRCGISPKAMSDRLEGAWKKIGKRPIINAVKAKTKGLPTDKRGQDNLCSDDDRRK